MEMWHEGLKHPECKIGTLQLHGEYCADSFSRHLAEIVSKNQSLRGLHLSFRNSDDRAVHMLCEGLKHPDCKVEKLRLDEIPLTETCGRHFAEVLSKNQSLRELHLSFCNTDDRALQILLEQLNHPDCKVQELSLDEIPLTETRDRHFAEVLSKNQSLRELHLSFCNTDDRALQILLERLNHPDCKVQELSLEVRSLGEYCTRHLAEIFRTSQRCRMCGFSFWNSDDTAVEVLHEEVKDPDCKVDKLRVDKQFLTDSYGTPFAEIPSKNQRLRQLRFVFYNANERAVEILCEGLKHPDCKVEELRLSTGFCADFFRHFAEVLSKNQRLRDLELSFYDANERAVEMLCEGLKHPDCKVEKLWLDGRFLTESCGRPFAETLSKNQRLKEFKISLYNTEGRVVEMLCEGLKHPDCKVEKLSLDGGILTESCGRLFAETLSKNQRLKELNISLYDTEGRGVEVLCEGLKHPDCKVEKLWLDGQFHGESGSRHFAEVLSKNQRLKELNISLYDTENRAVQMLCEGLKHPDCKVEKLWLNGGLYGESGSRHFEEVLSKNQRLKELNISLYDAEGRAVEMLCEGLKHPDCKVEKLWLHGRFLTESCGRPFGETLSKNQRLKELNISLYDTENRAVEMLCEGLKHPDCKVEKLWLDGRILNESCGRPFAETLNKNQRLKELNISLYDTENRAVEMLCEGLKHPDCKVEKLWLDGRFLTESCGRPFAETVSKNQRLKELKISLYDTEGRAVEMLCEGLKHPDCTVEKLWFDGQFHGESGSRHFAEVLSKNQKLKELKISLYDTEGRAVEMLCEGLKHPDCKVQKLSLNGKDIIRNGEWNDILVWGKDLWSQEEGLQPVMAQAQDADSESETDLEEATPAEPVEFQPQERQGQESHEAGETQAPPEQLENSDEDDIRPPSPRRRRVE